ncbi:MAG: GGDEF domain-containing protein [Firmicutes bacterium]|nr:GGDEF domain-containing protein [Bacillota bacterium]
MKKQMMKKVNELYKERQYINTLQIGRIASVVSFIIMFLALYGDIKVFHYNTSVSYFRIITMLFFLSFLIITLTPLKDKKSLVLRFYDICISLASVFSYVFYYYIYNTQNGIYNDRVIQIFIIFFIGILLFSAGTRKKVPYIIGIILLILTFDLIFISKLTLNEIYKFFNVYTIGLITAIMAYKLEEKSINEFRLRKLSDIHLNQLRLEVEARKKAELTLKKKANTDELTNIYNRRAGFEILIKYFKQSLNENQPLSICFIDLDDLKEVNDKYGHAEGDSYILTITDIVKSSIRPVDIFMRLGGDEFLIVFPNTSNENAENIWSRIKDNIKKANSNDKPYLMSSSHGIATFENNNFKDINHFVEYADKKMYQEKSRKKLSLE